MNLIKLIPIVIVLLLNDGVHETIPCPEKVKLSNPTKLLGCTPFNGKAERAVKFFLEHDSESMLSFRAETGTEGIPLSEIQHVNSSVECSQLDALVVNNTDLQKEDSFQSERDVTRYYYKTNNFYYIFYLSNKVRLGYTTFIVVDTDLQVKGIFGI